MSITNVGLSYESGSRSATKNNKFETTYKLDYIVQSDDKYDDASIVLNNFIYDGTFITIGTPYPGDRKAYCTGLDPSFITITETYGALWKVTATFGPWDPIENVENPLDAPIRPVIEPQAFEKVQDKDKDGNPIVNTAGDPYDPPIVKQSTHKFYRFTKNYAALPADDFVDCINDEEWNGFDPFTVKCNAPRDEMLNSQYLGSTYWKRDFEFEYNPDTWLRSVPNQGFRQLVSGVQQPILIGGQPTTTGVFLDIHGVPVVPPITDENILFTEYHVYDEVNFAASFPDFPAELFGVYAYPT